MAFLTPHYPLKVGGWTFFFFGEKNLVLFLPSVNTVRWIGFVWLILIDFGSRYCPLSPYLIVGEKCKLFFYHIHPGVNIIASIYDFSIAPYFFSIRLSRILALIFHIFIRFWCQTLKFKLFYIQPSRFLRLFHSTLLCYLKLYLPLSKYAV